MHYTTTVSFVDIFTRSLALVCVFTATCTVASLWSDCSTFRHTSYSVRSVLATPQFPPIAVYPVRCCGVGSASRWWRLWM